MTRRNGMRDRYHRGKKYWIWQGYTGDWWWQLPDEQGHRGGQAEDKRAAGRAARAEIDKLADHRSSVAGPYVWWK